MKVPAPASHKQEQLLSDMIFLHFLVHGRRKEFCGGGATLYF